ncbi:hypothetical protein [Peterkaempfera griseoplana]|uniref:hypothetical protein n=1 Tax=Peterkaempfera griseoplana TaxID=66896 RepID=UPI0006E194A1|nr:hypothetical protein [Peterkaempfera griseoplana]
MDFEHFAIRSEDGRIFYHLSGIKAGYYGQTTTVTADGHPMTQLGERANWWVVTADRVADAITVTYHRSDETVGWKIKDAAKASEIFPLELTCTQHSDLEESYGSAAYRLYEPVTKPRDPIVEQLAGPWRLLDGDAPEIKPDRPWVADIPKALIQHPQYHRYLPGRIPGLYSEVQERAKKMRHVQYAFDARDGQPKGLYITIQVPFETPRSRWRADTGRRGQELRSGRNVPVLARRELYLPVPDSVQATRTVRLWLRTRSSCSSGWAFWRPRTCGRATPAMAPVTCRTAPRRTRTRSAERPRHRRPAGSAGCRGESHDLRHRHGAGPDAAPGSAPCRPPLREPVLWAPAPGRLAVVLLAVPERGRPALTGPHDCGPTRFARVGPLCRAHGGLLRRGFGLALPLQIGAPSLASLAAAEVRLGHPPVDCPGPSDRDDFGEVGILPREL